MSLEVSNVFVIIEGQVTHGSILDAGVDHSVDVMCKLNDICTSFLAEDLFLSPNGSRDVVKESEITEYINTALSELQLG
jgi:hypothetical protein